VEVWLPRYAEPNAQATLKREMCLAHKVWLWTPESRDAVTGTRSEKLYGAGSDNGHQCLRTGTGNYHPAGHCQTLEIVLVLILIVYHTS
jgi:hypothetical protein